MLNNDALPILYKLTTKGQVQTWSIYTDNAKYYTVEGLLNGKSSTSKPTLCQGKNQGRTNETTDQEQAIKEAKAKWQKQLDKGYSISMDNLQSSTGVMLAQKYSDYPNLIYPVLSQPKLDGIRCETSSKSYDMKSRNGKLFVSAPHVWEELKFFFALYPDVKLDGELYNHELKHDFNKISSLIKKQKPTHEQLQESKQLVQYHVYDVITTGTFTERIALLNKLKDCKYIKIVDTFVSHNKVELDFYYSRFIEEGYEGQMIRYDKTYEHKRSQYLLKRKEFFTEEYVIVGITEGQGNKTGVAGSVTMQLNDTTFNSNIKGDRAWLRAVWEYRDTIIGKLGTVRFPNLTPAGVPRFPYMISVRDYE